MTHRPFTRGLLALAVVATLAHATTDPPTLEQMYPRFAETWYDGRAELSGYQLTYPRYGQPRTGTAVTIFVTERFDQDTRVKTDRPDPDNPNQFNVMKLVLVEDFQTGIYDYNMTTSTFLATEPDVELPTKVSFGAQEWCGHAYHQLLFNADHIHDQWHSYFDGEADGQTTLDYPDHHRGIAEDALFHWARGLSHVYVLPGESHETQLLRSLAISRLRHVPVAWEPVTLSRAKGTKTITVPAGEFEVHTMTARIDGPLARTWTFEVEHAWPHRIVQWSRSDGYAGQMLGSTRLPYWQLGQEGSEKYLKELGIDP